MLFVDFAVWWYGRGWMLRLRSVGDEVHKWGQFFSLGTLLLTLFSPWRQIITPKSPDRSLNDMVRGLIDNTISRFVGFWVRLFVFVAGIVTLTVVAVITGLFFIIWPLIPLSPFLAILWGSF